MTGAPEPGQEIDGFVVGELLHTGGMGTVHRVSRSGTAEALVLKVPRLGGDGSSENVLGFETEATILATLEGPHVPRLVVAGDLARIPYIVEEWIEGQTLEELFAGGPVPPAELASLGAATADALHSVHQQGVVHLDVKPGNVVLRRDGTAVLIDFGLSHHARYPDLHAEETRFRAGSAPYLAPDQEKVRQTLAKVGQTVLPAFHLRIGWLL